MRQVAALTLIACVSSAQTGVWRGLSIADENRCAPYSADDYRYSASVENGIVDSLGGVYSPYTGECASGSPRKPKRMSNT